jgi:hypothetical protein
MDEIPNVPIETFGSSLNGNIVRSAHDRAQKGVYQRIPDGHESSCKKKIYWEHQLTESQMPKRCERWSKGLTKYDLAQKNTMFSIRTRSICRSEN